MRVLIAYRSKYGATASCAVALARMIQSPSQIIDLAHTRSVAMEGFDYVLIGGSIYGGRILPPIESFCEKHRDELLGRKTAVFLCCFYQGEHARTQLREAFPPWLLDHCFAQVLAGGALVHSKLTLPDRFLVRRLLQGRRDIQLLKPEALQGLADAVNAFVAT